MKEKIDKTVKTVEGAGNVFQGLGRIANLIILVVVLAGGWFAWHTFSNLGGVAIEAVKQVIEDVKEMEIPDVDLSKVEEKTSETMENLNDAINENEESRDKLDKKVDGAIDWLKDKKTKLKGTDENE